MKDRATVLCRRREKILLVTRRWSRWALPGGTIGRNETPHDAARRELAEETTVAVDSLTYLFEFRGLGKNHHIFLIDLPDHFAPAPSREIVGCEWFRPDEVPMLITSAPTREIVRLAFRHRSHEGAPPLSVDGPAAPDMDDAQRAGEPGAPAGSGESAESGDPHRPATPAREPGGTSGASAGEPGAHSPTVAR
ncbi:MAG TPA: NUDIX domain-containing protein [Paraburkholderia sp.]|nr:NUDIX domain-containing protein [Paraburkholderia sp.]